MFQTTNQAIIVFLSISIRFVDLFCAGRTPTLEAPTKNSFSLRLTMRRANCSAWDPYGPSHGGLPGWWLSPTPPKNMTTRQLGWCFHSQLFLESHSKFQSVPVTTNQLPILSPLTDTISSKSMISMEFSMGIWTMTASKLLNLLLKSP